MTEEKRLNNEKKFIEKAKEVHGDRYDYSKVKYIGALNNVEIICSEHGSFWKTPDSHRNKQGCPKCAGVGLNNTEIIDRFVLIHGDKYDYSNVEYIKAVNKVEIICSEHGSFWQRPSDHRNGDGCPKCTRVFPLDKVLDQFREVHGDRYDYSKVDYINTGIKVEITCSSHGSFWQKPSIHKKGSGCPKCTRLLPLDRVFDQFREVHGDKYDYSKVKYRGSDKLVEILCPDHGSFWQMPSNHKSSNGCPKCKESKGEKRIREYLESKNIKYNQEYIEPINYEETLYNHRFDFYLPDHKTYIEYDGIQHFEPIGHFGGEVALQDRQFKDSLKDLFCENNNFKIVRIPYWDFDEIENILDEFT